MITRASLVRCYLDVAGHQGCTAVQVPSGDVVVRRWGLWSVGGGTAGTGEGNPGLLPEGGQVVCHRAGCRYSPQGLADDQGTLDRRVSGVPGRVGGGRLGNESGLGDARVADP